MEFSLFGERLSRGSGIQELMDDLGSALEKGGDLCMLGGGNPAHIPEVNRIWRARMEAILNGENQFENMVANYDSPGGMDAFKEALAKLLSQEYGWKMGPENIAITGGSQTAFFFLLNMFSGTFSRGRQKKILFPCSPEYIGYADQGLEAGSFCSVPSRIEETRPGFFKYFVDFARLSFEGVGAMAVSRPTNPTGNVLTDHEIEKLAALAEEHGIPLLVDNAYGSPFPEIIFKETKPFRNKNIILSMSLSKLGLPSTRTGIVVGPPDIIEGISRMNAITSLTSSGIGQRITLPLIKNHEILNISRNIIKPYYLEKSRKAIGWIQEFFPACVDYRIHESEGALFLWIWFKNLPIDTFTLYNRLKAKGVLIIPGKYFFFGQAEEWEHKNECIRLTYAQKEETVNRGIRLIGEELGKLY